MYGCKDQTQQLETVMQRWNEKATEIDGKWYVELNQEIVELQPKKVEVKVGGEVVSFVENSIYENHYGFCHVWNLKDDGTMDVEYIRTKIPGVIVGQKNTYPIKAQAETIFNERRRETAKMNRIGVANFSESDMFVLGYLFSHGTISVQTNSSRADRFEDEYSYLTGEKPVRSNESGESAHWTIAENYWGLALCVSVKTPSDEILSNMKLPHGIYIKDGSLQVWNNEFVWGLIRMGMRIGKNGHQLKAMASQLTGAADEKFMEGVRAGRKEANGDEVEIQAQAA